ncbi:MAG: hypothetical protein ACI86H_000627 [bacterium]|jgi:hypothetical protein
MLEKVEQSILNSIQKNGFPDKKVALPFRAIFNSCKNNGVKLADVLKNLKDEESILSDIGEERITFFTKEHKQAAAETEKQSSLNPEDLFSGDFMQKAMEGLKDIDPSQFSAVQEKMANMSDEEKANMMKMASEMMKENQK